MLVIHDDECKRLDDWESSERPNRCTCHAPTAAQLDELVEAAKMWVALDQDSVPLEQIFAVEERLDAALKPFVKEKKNG